MYKNSNFQIFPEYLQKGRDKVKGGKEGGKKKTQNKKKEKKIKIRTI